MKEPRTKQQHYVSRFYLEYFADSDGLVWTYDSADDKCWATTAENTAKQSNFYSPKDAAGNYLDDIERWLSDIETKSATLYPRVLDGESLKHQERADFSAFIASLLARSPANVRSVAELQGKLLQKMFQPYLADRERYDAMIDSYDKAKGTTTSKEDRDKSFEFGRDRSRYTLEVAQHAGLMGIVMSDALVPIVFRMTWNLIVFKDQGLVTSDNPVVRLANPNHYHPVYGDGGFMGKDTYVTFPLSPNRLLQLSWDKRLEGKKLAGKKGHRVLFNRQRAYFADRYLYASRKDVGIQSLARKYKDPGLKIEMSGQDELAPVRVTRSLKWN